MKNNDMAKKERLLNYYKTHFDPIISYGILTNISSAIKQCLILYGMIFYEASKCIFTSPQNNQCFDTKIKRIKYLIFDLSCNKIIRLEMIAQQLHFPVHQIY